MSFELVFSCSSDKQPGIELLGFMIVLFLIFEEFPYCFPQLLCDEAKLGSAPPHEIKPIRRHRGVVKESAVFIAGSPGSWCLKGLNSSLAHGFQGKVFKDRVREGAWSARGHSSDWSVVRSSSQHHQPCGSDWSEIYVLMRSTQLTSSTWWGFLHLQNCSKDVTQYNLQPLRRN